MRRRVPSLQTLMWTNMLDLLRYLVVWNPLILIFIQLTARLLGLTEQH